MMQTRRDLPKALRDDSKNILRGDLKYLGLVPDVAKDSSL